MTYIAYFISDYSVMTIHVDESLTEDEAELEASRILADYVKDPSLFYLEQLFNPNI